MDDYLSLIHWSFFAVALLVAVLSKFIQQAKTKFKNHDHPFLNLLAGSQLLSALLGILMGLIPGTPAPEMIGTDLSFAHVLYFGTAGIVGMWVFGLAEKLFVDILPSELKQWVEKKFGTEGDPKNSGIDDDTTG